MCGTATALNPRNTACTTTGPTSRPALKAHAPPAANPAARRASGAAASATRLKPNTGSSGSARAADPVVESAVRQADDNDGRGQPDGDEPCGDWRADQATQPDRHGEDREGERVGFGRGRGGDDGGGQLAGHCATPDDLGGRFTR